MKRKKLYLMCGPSGAGKSTWIKNNINPDNEIWCSRDKVRFSLVKETEDYFSRENEVFLKWIDEINAAIHSNAVAAVYADATHISPGSRLKTLSRIDLKNVDIIAVVVKPDLQTCIDRNSQRNGREKVPNEVIESMHNKFVLPSAKEKYHMEVVMVNG